MNTIEIARKCVQLNRVADAQKSYMLCLNEFFGKNPEIEMEASTYILSSGGDYKIAYSTFISLYNRGFFKQDLFNIMMQAFYLPNVEKQKKLYNDNCKRLGRYPYLFRKDFISFDDLPIFFFPYDDNGFIPYYKTEDKFGSFINFNEPVIDRYFFKDLENPILADDVYSQYQLEYLNDNVRKSEHIAKENHIYLHYTDWTKFCTYLQCISFLEILRDQKFVFLIEEEISQYPIDFKERFGIDYSKYDKKVVGIREINRLIWHTQLSSHNGGDFFNEIFYGHPNLLILDDSIMLDGLIKSIETIKKSWKKKKLKRGYIRTQLEQIKYPTDKDFLVALYISTPMVLKSLESQSRIVPALFIQPHFHNIEYEIELANQSKYTLLYSKQYEKFSNIKAFNLFKYIKTFTPLRRMTTSYAATVRFCCNEKFQEKNAVITDQIVWRILNQSFRIDPQDKFYRDSVLVRFEDGKLNPKATFTALAEFLDIPYTESMTYCSSKDGLNPGDPTGEKAKGFSLSTVYNTYDEFANDNERELLEYFMRDVYKYYGYDFNYYKGEPVDDEWIVQKVKGCTCIEAMMRSTLENYILVKVEQDGISREDAKEDVKKKVDDMIDVYYNNRLSIARLLQRNLPFVNRNGQPLKFMTPLKLDPELLEQPLYH